MKEEDQHYEFLTTKVNFNRMNLFVMLTGERRTKNCDIDKSKIGEILEALLSLKLKSLCDEANQEITSQKSASIFHELGKIYRKRSPTKQFLIKSAILFNAALARKPKILKKTDKDLNELCLHVLELAGADKPSENLIEKVEEFKIIISRYREKIQNLVEVDIIGKPDDVVKRKMIVFVENLQVQICQWYSGLMKNIMEYCVSVIGKSPCRYALVGMGSIAKNEITPYSDFEHIILLEEGVQEWKNYKKILEYFRWLSVIFHIIIANLGETIIPSAALPYLNNPWDKTWDWFYDAHTKKGISFDGMFPSACKFPLGRPGKLGWTYSAELIKPASRMLMYISNDEEHKNGYHLPELLTSTCFVCGDENIYKVFALAAEEIEPGKNMITNQLVKDLKHFNPINNLSHVASSERWNIKRVVYRTVSLFVEVLGKHFFSSLPGNSSFNTIRKLAHENVIAESVANNILFALAVACYVRLSIYCSNDRQEDWLECNENDNQFVLEFIQVTDHKTAITYFQTAMQLQRVTCKLIGLRETHYIQLSPELDRLLSCYWLKQFDEALWEAEHIYQTNRNYPYVIYVTTEVLLNIAKYHFDIKKFSFSCLCFEQVYRNLKKNKHKDNKTDTAYCQHFIGECCYRLEKYSEALHHFQLEISELTSDTPVEAMLNEGRANTSNWIGICFYKQGQYSDAFKHCNEAAKIQERVSDRISTDETLAFCYFNIGLCYFKMEKYSEAKNHFHKSKIILENIGEKNVGQTIANTSEWIGHCFYKQDLYADALKYYNEAALIQERVSNQNSEDETWAEYYFKLLQNGKIQ